MDDVAPLSTVLRRGPGWTRRVSSRLRLDEQQVAAFCRRWRIVQLEVFGSVLRDDFDAASDADLLVTFEPDAAWSLLDHVAMEDELSDLLGRRVDLVTRRSVERSENLLRRAAMLASALPLVSAVADAHPADA